MSMITDKYDEVTEKLDNSDLPEYNDVSRMKDCVLNYLGE